MIPNITRGSNPKGLLRYLFGKGRHNEHTDQHLLCASEDMLEAFDMTGQPVESWKRLAERFDRRYRMMERKGQPCPPDQRGKHNPEREPGKQRLWHCSLAIKAGHGILTDQQWQAIIQDYLQRMGITGPDNQDNGQQGERVTWLAVRHGLSRNGNDHAHIVVQLATDDTWINPYHDRIHAQRACRAMEEERAELIELHRTTPRNQIRWSYSQYRMWAQWKAEHDYQGDIAWHQLDPNTRSRHVARVMASSTPKHHVGRIIEACAHASGSEDEFIRRVRREGFNIDPRLRKGVTRDRFTTPEHVVGYRITWRSRDGWTERFNAFDLGDDMRLKHLRDGWRNDTRTAALTVQEWRAAMENRAPVMRNGAEKQAANLTTRDMERLIDQAFHIANSLDASNSEYGAALREGLKTFDRMRGQYGLPQAGTPLISDIPGIASHTQDESQHKR
ncbi:MAG: relaxase [Bifidobacterium crudilactis]|jgi:hypothetical protein|nr:relaxase [Bifidobacterium crudilactis]